MRDFGLGKQSLDERIKNEALTLAEQFRGRNGQAFDPQDDLSKAVSNIICSIAFGKRYYYVFTNSEPLQKPFYHKHWWIGGGGTGTRDPHHLSGKIGQIDWRPYLWIWRSRLVNPGSATDMNKK